MRIADSVSQGMASDCFIMLLFRGDPIVWRHPVFSPVEFGRPNS